MFANDVRLEYFHITSKHKYLIFIICRRTLLILCFIILKLCCIEKKLPHKATPVQSFVRFLIKVLWSPLLKNFSAAPYMMLFHRLNAMRRYCQKLFLLIAWDIEFMLKKIVGIVLWNELSASTLFPISFWWG